MTAILAVASITLAASFFCSLFEAALYSITLAQTELLRARRVFGADLLVKLRTHIDDSIAAILTINTIAHTVGSAWCGYLVGLYFSQFYVGVFAAVFTLAVLALTEILPKSLGVRYAIRLGPFIAWPLQVMIWGSYPFVYVCGLMMRAIGMGKAKIHAPTEEEIMAMTRLAMQEGTLRPQELRWVENALRLDRIKAYDLMTPRTVVYTLPADLKLADVKQRSEHWVHSRLPLTEDRDPDTILGMVYRRDVFDNLVKGNKHLQLRDLMLPIDFVPGSMRGHQLLDKFIKEKKHMVAVLDEYGGFDGVVTLEDVLECLLGSEIVDEYDRHVDMQQLALQKARYREKVRAVAQPAPAESQEKSSLALTVDPPATSPPAAQ